MTNDDLKMKKIWKYHWDT